MKKILSSPAALLKLNMGGFEMITKEQAENFKEFLQISYYHVDATVWIGDKIVDISNTVIPCHTIIKWRANGKCKTWKSKGRENEFKLPIKQGHSYGYLTQDNAHLFEVLK